MAELLEAWTDSGVNRVKNTSLTLIIPKLYNNENEMEKPEVDNVEKEQSSVLEKPKNDEVEEY